MSGMFLGVWFGVGVIWPLLIPIFVFLFVPDEREHWQWSVARAFFYVRLAFVAAAVGVAVGFTFSWLT